MSKQYVNLDCAYDQGTLTDWYISSVSPDDDPVWTDEHIDELINDFYLIPKDSPTVEAEPIRLAHWQRNEGCIKHTECGFVRISLCTCSECGVSCNCKDKLWFNYCPNCGAKMDGDINVQT